LAIDDDDEEDTFGGSDLLSVSDAVSAEPSSDATTTAVASQAAHDGSRRRVWPSTRPQLVRPISAVVPLSGRRSGGTQRWRWWYL